MKIAVIAAVAGLALVGCQSSTTNSYVYIGDSALKDAQEAGHLPVALKPGLKATPTDPMKPTDPVTPTDPSKQGEQSLSGQSTNGTTIIIGVNSTTSKPVDVKSSLDGNQVTVPSESKLKTAGRLAGAAVGTAATGGNPAGAAAGALLPEAVGAVKDVTTQALNAATGSNKP